MHRDYVTRFSKSQSSTFVVLGEFCTCIVPSADHAISAIQDERGTGGWGCRGDPGLSCDFRQMSRLCVSSCVSYSYLQVLPRTKLGEDSTSTGSLHWVGSSGSMEPRAQRKTSWQYLQDLCYCHLSEVFYSFYLVKFFVFK